MFDFVKRSNQLMFGAAKESLTDYTRDLSELGNAANQVREKLSSGTRSARDTMNNYKSTGIVSGISNWFYGKEFELGDSDEMLFDSHEFNSGNPEWQDNDSEEAPSPLTNSSMKELVKGQVSSMYKIGSKQTEAGIANTAEIVSTMTKSSAEIIASINNVNSSLITISGKIDSLVEAIRPPQQSQSGSNDGWFDSNGRFTVRSMMQGLMNPSNLSGSAGMIGSVASMLADPNMRKMFLTPENLMSMFVMDPLKKKDFDVLGGHSVDYYGKKFQTMTHNMIEETIEKLMEKTPLGDMMGKEKYRGNLGKVDNQYTKEAAVFDKATRHSIVSIIPEYLKKMTEAITGQKWNINEKGYLTTKEQANPYSRIGNVLHDASLDYEDYKHLSKIAEDKGSKISSTEMDDAQRAWIWVIVQYVIYDEGRDNITGETIRGMLMSPKLDMYLEKAAQIYNTSSGNKSKKKAKKILRDVLMMICEDRQSASSLAAAGNKYMRQIEDSARDISNNDPTAGQYVNQSSLNFDTTFNNFLSNQKEINYARERARYEQKQREELKIDELTKLNKHAAEVELNKRMTAWDKANPSSEKEEEVTSRIGLGGGNTKGGFNDFIKEMNQFSKGIYDILKSGVINVKIVTDVNPQSNNNQQRSKKKRRRRKKKTNNKGSSDDSGGDADVIEDVEDATEEEETTSSTMDGIASIVQARNEANPIQTFTNNFVSDVKSNGLVSTVKSRLNAGKEIAKDKYTTTKNTLKLESISDKVNAEGSKVSEMDKQRVQMVNTALQTAMQDGDGVEDKSKIRQLISNIDDQDLKQEMSKLADSVLTKESSDDEKGGKPKSLIGRLLGGIGGKLKSAFSFVLKPVTALLSTIGKGLKAYWDWTKKTWKSGLEDGKRGAGKIKNALFGGKSDKGSEEGTAEASSGEKKSSSGGSMMDDISSIKKTSSDLGGKSETTKSGVKTSGDKAGTKSDSGGGKAKQLLSGGFDIASMVMKLIGPILAGMAGVQMLVKLVQGTLKKILEPLNKLFKALFKSLSPILDILTESLTPFIEHVVDTMVNIITPLMPILKSIFECVGPILDIITVMLDSIMVPLMVIFDTIIVPVLDVVTGCLKVVIGTLQIGFGVVEGVLGSILSGIGTAITWISLGASSAGRKVKDKGNEMSEKGEEMRSSGAALWTEGMKEAVLGLLKLTGPGMIANALSDDEKPEKEEDNESAQYQSKVEVPEGGSAMDGIVGSGDVVNNYYYQNMYGSGNNTYNQNSYHNGMNMSQHGCGPIALADRANRMGGGINPYSLTQAMMANGNYSPNAGTSVAGMISTGHTLGMNLVPGGVTAASLRGASPNNPITVIGSGMGFGTRSGANHYVNVVGTDSAGGAYVSNPMTGRVGRVKANELVANSKLGLYGSGDDISYKEVFGDKVASAFGELTNIWSNISNIFNFKDNETVAQKTQKKIDTEKNKRYIDNVKSKYSDEEWNAKYNELKNKNPIKDGESKEDYEYRLSLLVAKELGSEYNKNNSITTYKDFGENFTKDFDKFMQTVETTMDESVQSEGGGNPYGATSGDPAKLIRSAALVAKAAKDMSYDDTHSPTGTLELDDGSKITNVIRDCSGMLSAVVRHMGYNIHGSNVGNFSTHDFVNKDVNDVITNQSGETGDWELRPFDNNDMKMGDMNINKVHMGMFLKPGRNHDFDYGFDWGSTTGFGQSAEQAEYYLANDKDWLTKLKRVTISGYDTSSQGGWTPATKTLRLVGGQARMTGDTVEENIFSYLVNKGMTPIGAAGLMGIWKHESGMASNNLENAYNSRWGIDDETYTAKVNSHEESEDDFVHGRYDTYMSHQTPGEAVGYGLSQFTSSGLKQDLYNKTVKSGQSIDYLPGQLDVVYDELGRRQYKGGSLLDAINNAATATEANQYFLWRYEAGTGYTSDEGVLGAYSWMGNPTQAADGKTYPNAVIARHKSAEYYLQTLKDMDTTAGWKEYDTSPKNDVYAGAINSNPDAYRAGLLTEDQYKRANNLTGPGDGGSSNNNDGTIWVDNRSFKNKNEYEAWKKAQNQQAEYKKFYDSTLKKKYDKATPDGSNYRGYPNIVLQDYKRAVLTPWSAYLDPDRNGVNGLYISHNGAEKVPHFNNNKPADIYSDIRKNGMLADNTEAFQSAVEDVIASDASLGNVKTYLNYVKNSNNLPKTQGGKATPSQTKTDHMNMLYDYALDKLIGRENPGYVLKDGNKVILDHMSMKNKFSDLKYSSPVPIGFQSYIGIHGNDYDVKALNEYYKGADSDAKAHMTSIPAIFTTKGVQSMKKLRDAYGSGDEIATDIVDIPPIDYSKFTDEDWNNTIWNSMNNQTPTQQYVPTEDTAKNDQIDRILANEFKTSDKRTHDLLEKICDYLEKEKEERQGKPDPNSPNPTPQGSQDMFENEIPNSVYRLARG